MTTETERLVYTIDELSQVLRLSRNLTYKLCREKKIPGVIELGNRRMVVSVAAINRLLAGNGDKAES
jgi:predicted DNA-binding transcriptional regulator AlpA